MGAVEGALTVLDKALELEPTSPEATVYRSRLLQELDQDRQVGRREY